MTKIKLNKLNSGDILLFHQKKQCIGKCIQFFTKSKFCHVGMVLKDPIFLNKNLKGLYLLESGYEGRPDSINHKIKYGVQIQRLENVIEEYGPGNVYVRKLYLFNPFNNEKFKKIYNKIKNKPYDFNPLDWIEAELKIKCRIGGDTDKTFWCSALLGYVYLKMGFIKKPTHWSLLSPEDWNSKERKIRVNKSHLSKEFILDF